MLHRWLNASFPEPGAWFQARSGYARTGAVWSMVGHMIGLGDRHGENVMLDTRTGDFVHVDLSCLFDKARAARAGACVGRQGGALPRALAALH